MEYTILNKKTGETSTMKFSSKSQLITWLAETGWECLGETTSYLPTRHVRMQPEQQEEFSGWGS